jgi:putative transposase
MANTYSQIYIHVVFAVKGRSNLIAKSWRERLYQYTTGVIRSKKQKVMIINGVADHVHILLGLQPDCTLSDLLRDTKASTSKWINENRLVAGKFEWQAGFGSFSVGASQVQPVINYIAKQEEHHKTKTFTEEYIEFLKAYEIDYKPDYLFDDRGVPE